MYDYQRRKKFFLWGIVAIIVALAIQVVKLYLGVLSMREVPIWNGVMWIVSGMTPMIVGLTFVFLRVKRLILELEYDVHNSGEISSAKAVAEQVEANFSAKQRVYLYIIGGICIWITTFLQEVLLAYNILPLIVKYLLAGLWVNHISTIVRRYSLVSLTPHVLFAFVGRLWVVLITAILLNQTFSIELSGFIHRFTALILFILGMSYEIILTLLHRWWILRNGELASRMRQIEGISAYDQTTLASAGIDTPIQLAQIDILDLRWELPFVSIKRLYDWVDQALLRTHADQFVGDLSEIGVRTATDFAELWKHVQDDANKEMLNLIATRLNYDQLQIIYNSIIQSPNYQIIQFFWKRLLTPVLRSTASLTQIESSSDNWVYRFEQQSRVYTHIQSAAIVSAIFVLSIGTMSWSPLWLALIPALGCLVIAIVFHPEALVRRYEHQLLQNLAMNSKLYDSTFDEATLEKLAINARLYNHLTVLLAKLGRSDEAICTIEKALARYTSHAIGVENDISIETLKDIVTTVELPITYLVPIERHTHILTLFPDSQVSHLVTDYTDFDLANAIMNGLQAFDPRTATLEQANDIKRNLNRRYEILGELLGTPLVKLITQHGYDSTVLCASGLLAQFPLSGAVLLSDNTSEAHEQNLQYVADVIDIQYALNARILKYTHEMKRDETQRIVAVGDATNTLIFAPIELYLLPPEADIVTDTDSKYALLQQIEGATHVHFACHGMRVDNGELQNKDVFAQGLILTENTVLNASDIRKSSVFDNCELCVLSACSVGASSLYAPNEALGLVSAFVETKTRLILSNVWRIDDSATYFLMQKFYGYLFDNRLSAVRALRSAQGDLRQLQVSDIMRHFIDVLDNPALTEDTRITIYHVLDHYQKMPKDFKPFEDSVYWAGAFGNRGRIG